MGKSSSLLKEERENGDSNNQTKLFSELFFMTVGSYFCPILLVQSYKPYLLHSSKHLSQEEKNLPLGSS